MHEYDTVLKTLLQNPQNSILERITGARIDHWLTAEFPEVKQTRGDLLGETADRRRIIALELQSTNDADLPLRMAEYAVSIYRLYQRLPEQFVLYVGRPKMRMKAELRGQDFHCRYQLIDIRTLDEEVLLASPFASDNIIAILAKHKHRRETIRRILMRIDTLEGTARDIAFKKLTILAGLRKLGSSIRREMKEMPILDDIMDHDLLGPAIRQGIEQGKQEIVRSLMTKRFGDLPAWAEKRISQMNSTELEDLSLRLLDAKTLRGLLRR